MFRFYFDNFLSFFCIIIMSMVSSCSHSNDMHSDLTPEAKELYSTIDVFAEKYASENKFHVAAFGVGTDKNDDGEDRISKVKIIFQTNRKLSKDESRKMLMQAGNQLIQTLNANEKLSNYLIKFPYETSGLDITFFVRDSKKRNAYFPDLSGIKLYDNTLTFWSDNENGKFERAYEESETYEEALEKIKSSED